MATNETNRYTADSLHVSYRGIIITADSRSLSASEAVDTVDSSAGSSNQKSHILTLRGTEFTIEYLETLSTVGSALRTAMAVGNSGTLIYAPEGTAVGRPRYSCIASVVGVERQYPFDDIVTVSANLMKNGNWIAHYELLASVF